MLKNITLILSLTATLAFAQDNVTDLKALFLNNTFKPSPIDSYTLTFADLEAVNGKVVTQPAALSSRVVFDERGNTVEDYSYHPYGTLRDYTFKTYDARNQNIETVTYEPDGTLFIHFAFLYGEGQRQVFEVLADGTQHLQETTRYDENEREVERLAYNYKGEMTGRTVSDYDEAGNIYSQYRYGADEAIRYSHEFTYNEMGQLIESVIRGADGRATRYFVNQYDERGNKTESTVYDADWSVHQRFEYSFDRSGNKVASLWTSAFAAPIALSFVYDRYGNETETASYGLRGERETLKRCNYKLDEYTNWTQRTCVQYTLLGSEWQADYGASENEIAIRTITYRD